MPAPDTNRPDTETRRILDRVARESDSHGGQAHERPLPAEEDWAERTGRRIARYASVVLFAVLAGWLLWIVIGGGAR